MGASYNEPNMRLSCMIAVAVAAAPLGVPADMAKGLFRGSMVSWEGSLTKGVLLARNSAGTLEGCGYDALSYLELSRRRITIAKLEPVSYTHLTLPTSDLV